MIDRKGSIRLASSTSSQLPKPSIEDNATLAVADAAVQNRAYELYELGGRVDGHAEENWYQAETDLRVGEREDGVSTSLPTKPGKALVRSSIT